MLLRLNIQNCFQTMAQDFRLFLTRFIFLNNSKTISCLTLCKGLSDLITMCRYLKVIHKNQVSSLDI